MNKAEFVDAIAQKAEATKKDTNIFVDALTNVIIETVANGDKITLVGFGSFERRDRQAREGRNPSTGVPIKIPATQVPAFSAGKEFKEKVAPKPVAKIAAVPDKKSKAKKSA